MSTNYLNNLFGSVSKEVPWDTSSNLKWYVESDPVYIDEVSGGLKRGIKNYNDESDLF